MDPTTAYSTVCWFVVVLVELVPPRSNLRPGKVAASHRHRSCARLSRAFPKQCP